MNSVLNRIAADTLACEVGKPPLETASGREIRDVIELVDSSFFLIAEVKRKSPSRGVIRENFHPGELARTYEEAGASAVSVVTERNHFGGSPEHLAEVRELVTLPVLRKDFILTERQVVESFNLGADMLLLIAGCLEQKNLMKLHCLTVELGMTPLVEIHDSRELERVLKIDPILIGINNRNLHDFSVNIRTSVELGRQIPPGIRKISESGIKTPSDIRLLREEGFSGALVGETILTAADIGKVVKELLHG